MDFVHKKSINCIKHILTHIDYPDKISMKKLKTDSKICILANDEIKTMESEMTFKKN